MKLRRASSRTGSELQDGAPDRHDKVSVSEPSETLLRRFLRERRKGKRGRKEGRSEVGFLYDFRGVQPAMASREKENAEARACFCVLVLHTM